MAVAWSSSNDNAIGYMLTVLWMTSCLPIMGYIWHVAKRVYKVTHKGATPGQVVMSSIALFGR